MIIESCISYGYVELIKVFFKANELEVNCSERECKNFIRNLITFEYEDNSDTSYKIVLMSIRHSGFENMLCDYLIRCGIESAAITRGGMSVKRDMNQLDKDWEEHRKKIGLR